MLGTVYVIKIGLTWLHRLFLAVIHEKFIRRQYLPWSIQPTRLSCRHLPLYTKMSINANDKLLMSDIDEPNQSENK